MNPQNVNLIQAARNVLKASGYYVDHLWHISDVHFICEQLEMPKLAEDEAVQILTLASERFDGDSGISWPQIERALQLFLQRKKAVKELCPQAPRLEALW